MMMRLINNKILRYLSRLININLEVQSGYKCAAEIIKDENLKEIFIIYILKLNEYINELKRLEKELAGGKYIVSDQLKNISFSSSDREEISILKKCEMLEEKSIREYEIILNEEIPPNLKELFLKQYNGLQESRLHLRALEDQY